MAYLKKWRRQNAALRAILRSDSEEDQHFNAEIEQCMTSCSTQREDLLDKEGATPNEGDSMCDLDNQWLDSSSESDFTETYTSPEESSDLKDDLAKWAVGNKSTRASVDELPRVLQKHGHSHESWQSSAYMVFPVDKICLDNRQGRSKSKSVSRCQRPGRSKSRSRRPSTSSSRSRRRSPSHSCLRSRRPSPSHSLGRSRQPSHSCLRSRRPSPSHSLGLSRRPSCSRSRWPSPSTSSSYSRQPSRSRSRRRSPSHSRSQQPSPAHQAQDSCHCSSFRAIKFPLSEEKFQKKVLQLLMDLRNSAKKDDMTDGRRVNVKPADTPADFQELESLLKIEEERSAFLAHFNRLGGVDAVDMIKKSMTATLSNSLMAQMSLKGRCGKIAFSKTVLFQIICDAVVKTHQVTETNVMEIVSKYLKYAPERVGGGGRKKITQPLTDQSSAVS